jgi:hypothetical protein
MTAQTHTAMGITLTERQRHILCHGLGIPASGRPEKSTRNHFVSCEGHDANPTLHELAEFGLVKLTGYRGVLPPDSHFWMATDLGKQWAECWQKARWARVSRGKKRYLDWLEISDVCDISFGEWLRRGLYRPDMAAEFWGLR